MTPSTTSEIERPDRRMVPAAHGSARRVPRVSMHKISTLRRRQTQADTRTARLTTRTDLALVGLQLVIGYQWLVSGVDKLLLGTFPGQLGQLLVGQIGSSKLPSPFGALLRALVLPNAPFFGYAIMLAETLAGLGLVGAGLLALLRPSFEAHVKGRLWTVFAMTDRFVTALAPLAATGAGLLGLSYYLLDGAPTVWFTPALAYGGAIAPGMIVTLASLVLVVAQVVRVRTSR
jgi:hypothetical protein